MIRWVLQPLTWPGFWIASCSSFVLVLTLQLAFPNPLATENLIASGILWLIIFGVIFFFCALFGLVSIKETDRVLDPWKQTESPAQVDQNHQETAEEFLEQVLWQRFTEIEKERAER